MKNHGGTEDTETEIFYFVSVLSVSPWLSSDNHKEI
jgi:hypothetical protein